MQTSCQLHAYKLYVEILMKDAQMHCKLKKTHIIQDECEAFAHLKHIIFGQALPDSIADKMLSYFIIQWNFKWFPLGEEPEHDK